MENIYIHYHIKSIGKVVARSIQANSVEEVMREALDDIKSKEFILFNGGKNSSAVYGVSTDSIAFFEVMNEQDHKWRGQMNILSNTMTGAAK